MATTNITTKAFISTTSGLRDADMDILESTDKREIASFLAGNRKVMGITQCFAVNLETREVVEVSKKGNPAQRDIAPLLAEGFTQWMFSWAWSPKAFEVRGEVVKISREIDINDCFGASAQAFRRALRA